MPEFAQFDLAKAHQSAIQTKTAQQQLEFNTQKLNAARTMRDLQANSASPEEYADNLEKAGLFEESMTVRTKMDQQKIKDMEVEGKMYDILKNSVNLVTDEDSYQSFRHKAIKLNAASESDLPSKYDDKAKQLLKQISFGVDELMKFNANRSSDLTALQKNAPLVAKAFGITYNEAVRKLTESKAKGPDAFFSDSVSKFTHGAFMSPDEATKKAEELTKEVFPDWQRQKSQTTPGKQKPRSFDPATGKIGA